MQPLTAWSPEGSEGRSQLEFFVAVSHQNFSEDVTHAAAEVWHAARVQAWRQIGEQSQPRRDLPCQAGKYLLYNVFQSWSHLTNSGGADARSFWNSSVSVSFDIAQDIISVNSEIFG